MAKIDLPSPEVLRQLLRYDPETGGLIWRPRGIASWDARWADKPAFTASSNGYRVGHLHCRLIMAHRVIWAIAHGAWPAFDIDHINGDRSDNRLVNLRSVTRQENLRNSKVARHNTSGVRGVSRATGGKKWKACIGAGNRTIHLGRFDSFEEAVAARRMAEIAHGYHPNHGRS